MWQFHRPSIVQDDVDNMESIAINVSARHSNFTLFRSCIAIPTRIPYSTLRILSCNDDLQSIFVATIALPDAFQLERRGWLNAEQASTMSMTEQGPPNAALIGALMAALEMAQAGERQSLVATGFDRSGERITFWADHHAKYFEMLGSLAQLQLEYVHKHNKTHE